MPTARPRGYDPFRTTKQGSAVSARLAPQPQQVPSESDPIHALARALRELAETAGRLQTARALSRSDRLGGQRLLSQAVRGVGSQLAEAVNLAAIVALELEESKPVVQMVGTQMSNRS